MDLEQAQQGSYRQVLTISFVLGALLLRLVVDGIITQVGSDNDGILQILSATLALVIVAGLGWFTLQFTRHNPLRNREDYFKDFKRVLLLLFLSMPFLPLDDVVLDNLFLSIFSNLFSVVRVFTAFYTLAFYYKASWLHRHEKTKPFTQVALFGVMAVFILVSFQWSNYDTIEPIIVIMFCFLGVMAFLNVKRRTWIQALSYTEKKNLAWISVFGVILGFVACFSALSSTGEFTSFRGLLPGLYLLMAFAGLYLLIYSERVFWTTVFSLPNSNVIERRTFEFSSVAYLNKISAESTDVEKLFQTITSMARHATQATSAWCEIREDVDEYRLAVLQSVHEKQVQAISERNVLRSISQTLTEPLYIELLEENPQLSFLARSVVSFAQSIIIAPLYRGKEFIGCLYLTGDQPFQFEQEDVRAVSAFCSSANVALENARLVEESLESERYHRELMVGREIQRKLLPQTDPSVHGFDVAAVSSAALEVGGDYYDYFTLQDGRTCIVIADVSGKGISAAFYMAKLKGVCLAVAQQATGAADIVRRINTTLFGSMERQMYITLTAVVLSSDGTICIARAGHTTALLLREKNVEFIKPQGLGIGLAKSSFFDPCIHEECAVLKHSDVLILYTDGVNERRNPEGDEMGLPRMMDILLESASCETCTAKSIVDCFESETERFAMHTLQHDDSTIIAIRRVEFQTNESNGNLAVSTSVSELVSNKR